MNRGAILFLIVACVGCKSRPKYTPPPGTFLQMPVGQPPAAAAHVLVRGDVRNQVVPWTEGLTLATALDQAQYIGRHSPGLILIFRRNDVIQVSIRQLLGGYKDPPLMPNDVIEFR